MGCTLHRVKIRVKVRGESFKISRREDTLTGSSHPSDIVMKYELSRLV